MLASIPLPPSDVWRPVIEAGAFAVVAVILVVAILWFVWWMATKAFPRMVERHEQTLAAMNAANNATVERLQQGYLESLRRQEEHSKDAMTRVTEQLTTEIRSVRESVELLREQFEVQRPKRSAYDRREEG